MRHPGCIRSTFLLVLTTLLAGILASPRPDPLTRGHRIPSLGRGSRGQLAYIGTDGNVYVLDPGLRTRRAITRDATAPAEGSGRSYHRLAWSPDGQLAFAAVERSGSQATGQLYAVRTPDADPRMIAEDPDHFVIYIHWSPAPCSDTAACRRLGYLVQGADGVDLHLVSLQDPAASDRLVGTGRPFYISWTAGWGRPEGMMAWHTGPAGSRSTRPRLALYDIGRDDVQELELPPGSFLAPVWAPQGDRWLAVTKADGMNQLRLFVGERPGQVLHRAENEIVFSWSPDGDYVAYATRERAEDPFYAPIHMIEMSTGRAWQLTGDGFRIRGFFWSPVSTTPDRGVQRLAYLTWLDLPEGAWGQWRVIDVTSGKDLGFAAFRLAPLMRFAVHSFGQYAQSHRFWSPDGRYLVYTDRDLGGTDRIWLVDTWAEQDREPIPIAEGSLAYWSWQ